MFELVDVVVEAELRQYVVRHPCTHARVDRAPDLVGEQEGSRAVLDGLARDARG